LTAGKTTLKLGVPRSLSSDEIVHIPEKLGKSVLALTPVVNPDGLYPNIEIPTSVRSITIGRSSKISDVVIMASNLSRKHAQCIIYEKNIMLFDCGSSNGTFVNGEKITKKTIHPGDIVSFGDIQYFFGYAQ
jgi:pSer/pThr/pTyr-binding forkhead associated (FHA) protein